MRICSFLRGKTATYGVVTEAGVVDVGTKLKDSYPTLRSALAGFALAKVQEAAEGAKPDFGLDEIEFLPVIPDPDKIICVGLNYKSHVEETGRSDSDYAALFPRYANCQVGHRQPMIKPRVSEQFDYEGELAVIIGKPGRDVPEAEAMSHVAGYACYNDGSIRDWQRHTHQFLPGKNFRGTGAFGPWMVTADEIPDPAALTLTTRLNGEEMQKASVAQLIFTIPVLINYISTFTDLAPGDVIPTGTPGGVGFKRNPPVFMKAGDTIEVDIDGIGTLVNPVIGE